MSYEHCDKHDQDATNGCPQCAAEHRDADIAAAWDAWWSEQSLIGDWAEAVRAAFIAGWSAAEKRGSTE